MNPRIIATLALKDLRLFFKNRFFAFVTILGLVFYVAIYFFLPDTVDESLSFAMFAPVMPPVLAQDLENEGAAPALFDTEEALKEAVTAGDYPVGIALPEDLAARLASGQRGQIRVYFNANFPTELEDTYAVLMEEIGYSLSGQPLGIDVTEEVLGVDRAGQQIPQRDKMRPLFGVLVLLVETMGLASLISSEIVSGTLGALLVTPTTVAGVFAGKGVTGVGLAFLQATLVMAATGGLARQAGLILVTLFAGAILVTGVAFLVASVASDLMSVFAWAIPLLVVLMVPAIGALLPGVVSAWARAIPSFYLVDTVNQVANYGAGWADVGANLLILLAYSLGIAALGVLTLRRRFQ